jgi:virulence factor Mce-like protein
MPPLRAGLIALVVVAVGTYLGFTKELPFGDPYEIRAVFRDATLLQPRSPVRIAGVDVGKVTKVERYGDTNLSVVTMEIEDGGRPIRADAQLKIRPRLFLEGNFYIEMEPGTSRGRELEDGDLLPVTQTASPVQLDQVLSALDQNVRGSLQQAVKGFGDALGSKPTPAEDATQDPAVRGLTGGQALNETLRTSPDALRGTAIVMEALRGEQPRDLSRMISGFARAASALADHERDLRDLVADFNTTMATMAARGAELEQTVRRLGPAAENVREGLGELDRALPTTRRFARALTPAMEELPATIEAARPWLAQAAPLLSRAELGGLLDDLSPATRDLARLAHASRRFLPRIDAFNRCVTEVLIPTANIKVDDGPHSAGVENYKEFWYAMVGQASEGQSFDGNGPMLRILAAAGGHLVTSGVAKLSQDVQFANYGLPPLETRPAFPNKVPPLRRDVPCHENGVPDVNGPASRGPADGSAPRAPAPPPDREEGRTR